ncbi:SCO7460 family lipoprotein [Streptomyces apocyni]|uniref:SCO7460 family lipoprotein n=1 Tax=Streptomyces apocyni TaxID=2654677 RepID=UPI0012E9BD30|nr:hypothetical protein [Streptomyces apocyni]
MVASVVSLALACVGCGVLSTKEDQRRASALANELFPGKLEVISAKSLFPATLGSEVAFRLTDDADAVVRLRVDRQGDTCGREDCERALTKAVADARARARDLRTLTTAFADCGYEVHAVGQGHSVTQPWVVAAPTNATVTSVLAEIGACVEQWSRSRAAQDVPPPASGTTSVLVTAPEALRDRPTGGDDRPTLMRMTDPKLLGALSRGAYYRVSYPWRDGVADPGSGAAYLVRPVAERDRFGAEVREGVTPWLTASRPEAVLSTYTGAWRLLPGRVDRVKGYVLYCDEPDGRRRCLGQHAVAVTTDLSGKLIGEPTEVRDVRIGNGALRLPPL